MKSEIIPFKAPSTKSKIVGTISPLGNSYCPCCRGFGEHEVPGINLCHHCQDRHCGDEREWFDSHQEEVKKRLKRMF